MDKTIKKHENKEIENIIEITAERIMAILDIDTNIKYVKELIKFYLIDVWSSGKKAGSEEMSKILYKKNRAKIE